MPNFEDRPRRDSRDRAPRRDSNRDFDSYGGNRREVEMTKVICSSCGEQCEVPFKPTSTKPVYCKACFSGKNRGSSDRLGSSGSSDRSSSGHSSRDNDIINEKLNKIMKALKIDDNKPSKDKPSKDKPSKDKPSKTSKKPSKNEEESLEDEEQSLEDEE